MSNFNIDFKDPTTLLLALLLLIAFLGGLEGDAVAQDAYYDTDIGTDKGIDMYTDCTPKAYQQCGSDGNVHWFDSCDVEGAEIETCASCETCENTSYTTAECQATTSEAYQECGTDGNVHWFDSCYEEGAEVDTCATCETCENTSNTTAKCHATTLEAYQQCGTDGNAHWFDSCDVEGALVTLSEKESCQIVADTPPTLVPIVEDTPPPVEETETTMEDGLKDTVDLHNRGLGTTDNAHSSDLFRQACERGYAPSCLELGTIHLESSKKKDMQKGLKLIDHACLLGDADACAREGSIWWQGKIVKKDIFKAHRAYDRACRNGYARACAWSVNSLADAARAYLKTKCGKYKINGSIEYVGKPHYWPEDSEKLAFDCGGEYAYILGAGSFLKPGAKEVLLEVPSNRSHAEGLSDMVVMRWVPGRYKIVSSGESWLAGPDRGVWTKGFFKVVRKLLPGSDFFELLGVFPRKNQRDLLLLCEAGGWQGTTLAQCRDIDLGAPRKKPRISIERSDAWGTACGIDDLIVTKAVYRQLDDNDYEDLQLHFTYKTGSKGNRACTEDGEDTEDTIERSEDFEVRILFDGKKLSTDSDLGALLFSTSEITATVHAIDDDKHGITAAVRNKWDMGQTVFAICRDDGEFKKLWENEKTPLDADEIHLKAIQDIDGDGKMDVIWVGAHMGGTGSTSGFVAAYSLAKREYAWLKFEAEAYGPLPVSEQKWKTRCSQSPNLKKGRWKNAGARMLQLGFEEENQISPGRIVVDMKRCGEKMLHIRKKKAK